MPADMLSYVLVTEELGRGDSSVRGIVSVSLGLVTKSILSHGTEDKKCQWLPRLTSGKALGCFALTEPETGSDAGSLRTRAERDGDDWILSGQKMFITNGTWADVALLFARTGDGLKLTKGRISVTAGAVGVAQAALDAPCAPRGSVGSSAVRSPSSSSSRNFSRNPRWRWTRPAC